MHTRQKSVVFSPKTETTTARLLCVASARTLPFFSVLTCRGGGGERRGDHRSAVNNTTAALGPDKCTRSQSPRGGVTKVTARGSGGTTTKGRPHPKTFAALSTQRGRTGGAQSCCVDCDRLSKANAELKRLLRRSKGERASVGGMLRNPKTAGRKKAVRLLNSG